MRCVGALPAAAFRAAEGLRRGAARAAAAEPPLSLRRLERCAPDADALYRVRARREADAPESGSGAEAAAAAASRSTTRRAGESVSESASENARVRSAKKARAAATRDALRETQPRGGDAPETRRYSRLSLSRSR